MVPPEGFGTHLGESTVPIEGCGKPPHEGYAIPPEGCETLPGRQEVPPEQTKTQTEAPNNENKNNTEFPKKNENPPSSPPFSRVSQLDIACIPSKPDALNESDPKSLT